MENQPMAKATSLPDGFKPLLTKKEAAAFYTVTERTIDRWSLEKTLPANAKVVIGGSVRFRTAVLLSHIAGDHLEQETAQ